MKNKYLIPLSIVLAAIIYCAVKTNQDSSEALKLAKFEQHKKELIQHELDCDNLEICIEAELSYSEQLDNCYPIDPIWGWPGDKSEGLLTTCKLFKRIRRVSGQ